MSKIKVVMENGGEFVIELYPEYAPITVKNFEKLVKSGFYDGLTFHRVIDGFMAAGLGAVHFVKHIVDFHKNVSFKLNRRWLPF